MKRVAVVAHVYRPTLIGRERVEIRREVGWYRDAAAVQLRIHEVWAELEAAGERPYVYGVLQADRSR